MTSLIDKTILITGATDGLGKDVATQMASAGATILLHGRNEEKGKMVLDGICAATGNKNHKYYNADFSSLRQVHALAQTIAFRTHRLDMLINNAGIGSGEKKNERQFGEDGYELRFTVNYLAPFLLTNFLLPLLIKSAPSKIINVASGAQEPIDFSDVMMNSNYSGPRAYAQSKLALVMLTFDLAAKLKDKQITVNCLHPASMMDTKLVRESGGKPRTSVNEGTDTVMYVATAPETENMTGVYFDHHEAATAQRQAYDPMARSKLFELSVRLTEIARRRSQPLFFQLDERT